MIEDITSRLFSDIPQERLYHYTNFNSLLGIVKSRSLWASDIRYMNDKACGRPHPHRGQPPDIGAGHARPDLLNQFVDWVTHRITNGHMLFAASFRSNGNLLSQWRGYSRLGKGVSLGFAPEYILACAKRQSFQIGRCIYSSEQQEQLIGQVIDAVETLARQHDPDGSATADGGSTYRAVFHLIESDLLRISAILKHPAFREEDEWRIVSPVITDYVGAPVQFREGISMLVPYIEFNLATGDNSPISLDHIFLGPTPNITISMNSLSMFLAKNGIRPAEDISYCRIPFRAK